MIAAGYSACHGFQRDDGNRAHTPYSAHCNDLRHHVGDSRTDLSGHLCRHIRDFVAHDRVTGGPSADKLIMVTSRYPFAATTKTRCNREGDPSTKDESSTRSCASKATPKSRPRAFPTLQRRVADPASASPAATRAATTTEPFRNSINAPKSLGGPVIHFAINAPERARQSGRPW